MDQRCKIKCKTIQLLQHNTEENLDDLGYGDILDTPPETWSMKEIIDKLSVIKVKIGSAKDSVREWEDKSQSGRRYLQKEHLIKGCYPRYIEFF